MKSLRLGLFSSLVLLVGAACSGADGCKSDEDCPNSQKCRAGTCTVLCSCAPEEACTATAPECLDVTGEGDACVACSFNSECEDENRCTQDLCEGSCCVNRIYEPWEAVGCCTELIDCRDPKNPLADDVNVDGDPCTRDTCSADHQCVSVMENPACCRRDSDCSDGDDCTMDRCSQNNCIFGQPRADCCRRDEDCKDDVACTLDVCTGGDCLHPWNPSSRECRCSTMADCDDKNSCTSEACVDGECIYNYVDGEGCCTNDAYCDDQIEQTVDLCKLFRCVHMKYKTCLSDAACDDRNACTVDKCQDGVCTFRSSPETDCCNKDSDCNDGNPCTTGSCVLQSCRYQVLDLEGCCRDNLDCDDGVGCTIDFCSDWTCEHIALGSLCCSPEGGGEECNDGNPCTKDRCLDGICAWSVLPGPCCASDLDCSDCIDPETGFACPVKIQGEELSCIGDGCIPNPCTSQRCTEEGICDYDQLPNCCLANTDCKDDNTCTLDYCDETNECRNVMQAGCCSKDAMCNDGDPCTLDRCVVEQLTGKGVCVADDVLDCCHKDADCGPLACKEAHCNPDTGKCVYSDISSCCIHDLDCDDKNPCTVDKCSKNVCVYNPIPSC